MDDLHDELDLRYHRGIKPDVYYRCPTLESLDGALRNELQKSAASLIPVDIVTEFVFAARSTITVSMTQQPILGALIQPAEFPQSITINDALCHTITGKDRLKTQRAVARCFIETVQKIDGFKYTERQALNKENSDGTRFKYVCVDSLQNRDRKGNTKKEKSGEENGAEEKEKKRTGRELPTYDCGGAIHIKFSTKREAVNVVYKHNPIHRDVESRPTNGENGDSELPSLVTDQNHAPQDSNGTKPRKRKRSKKDHVEPDNGFGDPDLDMSTSPEASKTPTKKRRKKSAASASPEATRKSSTNKSKKGKRPESPPKSRKEASVSEPSPPLPTSEPIKGKACLRCREKKIKCNEVKPTCNQCRRGLWTCQYETSGPHKRSKNGCINCRQRKRKCTEEKPSCAHCLKVDDDCEYAEEHA